MYTIDDNYQEDEEYTKIDNKGSWQDNKGLIIKIIIIILCVILLIWLILALKNTNKEEKIVYDSNVHNANVLKVRLASEKYFFNNNLPETSNETKTITLKTLNDNKLIEDVVDSNKKVCDNTKSYVSLTNDKTVYTMKVKLSCSTDEKEETYFYNKNDYFCLNCNGNTYMDGNSNPEIEDIVPVDNYSCTTWSDWTSERVNDVDLIERSRVLVKGVKTGEIKEETKYSEWSDYTETPIEANDTIEVETKEEIENRWSEDKITTNSITNSETIRVINTSTTGGGTFTYCPNGYQKENGKCVRYLTGNLTYVQYNTYDITNKPCDDIRVEKNSDGIYETVFKNCIYKDVTNLRSGSSEIITTYTYQELVPTIVTYYRFRTVTKGEVKENDIYTDGYYEESKLPNGYKKLEGSEKIEYSYKLSSCEK